MRFVSEAIEPLADSFDPAAMATGGPGLPRQFNWRGQTYTVAEVLEQSKETGPCSHGSGEQYVRKHWFRVRTENGALMRLYFERQAASARQRKKRWWLHSIDESGVE